MKLLHPLVLLLVLICLSCGGEKIAPSQKSLVAENEPFALVNWNTGDTIETNKSIPLDTAKAYCKSCVRPVHNYLNNEMALSQFKSEPLDSNVYPISLIWQKKFYVDSSDIYYFSDDSLTPKPPKLVKLEKKIIPLSEPQQKSNLPWAYRNNAQFDLRYFGTDQGLNSESVTNIVKDDNGFYWFGTPSGLVRYDGKFSKTYTKNEGLPSDKITRLITNQGCLWVGTEDAGIFKFDGKNLLHIPIDSIILPSRSIDDMAFDSENNLWFSVMFGGIAKYDGEFLHCYGKEQGIYTSRPTPQLAIDAMDNVWLAGYGIGLYRIKNEKVVCFGRRAQYHTTYTSCLYVAKNGDTYFGGFNNDFAVLRGDSLFRYDIRGENLQLGGIFRIKEDSEGKIWFLSNAEGIIMLDENSATIYNQKIGMPGKNALSLYIDNNDVVWTGFEKGGVARLNPNSFKAKNKYNNFPNDQITKIKTGFNGNLNFSTYGGLYRVEGDSLQLLNALIPKKNNAVPGYMKNMTGLISDFEYNKKGDLIIAKLNHGFFHIRDEGFTLIGGGTYGPQNPACVVTDKDDNFWVGCFDGFGLYKITEDSVYNYRSAHGVYPANINVALCAKNGDLWFGSKNTGVFKLVNNTLTYFSTNEGLLSNSINSINEDKKGRIWIATSKGINYIENNVIQSIKFSDSKIPQNTMAVLQDKNSNYWITTEKGLINLIEIEPNEVFDLAHFRINFITNNNGLINSNFYPGSIFIDEDNLLYLGGHSDIIIRDLTKPYINHDSLNVFIESIELQGKHYSYGVNDSIMKVIQAQEVVPFHNCPAHMVLPPSLNSLSFIYSSSYIGEAGELEFEYYLEGLENEWKKGGKENRADYGNLNYGKYIFHLRVHNGNKSETNEVVYAFEIERAWYQTYLARAFFSLAFIAIVLMIVKIRTKKLRKNQKKLQQQISDATVEIRTQRDKIEETHKEITDSIAYAKRIQGAILPSETLMQQYLADFFILYLPKDVVAGDFYWLAPFKNGVAFAAADCTGHGVPGAMVSVVCNGALNRSVREFQLQEPAEILNKTREIVIEEFSAASSHAVNDGMDIGLCLIKGNELQFAGANNPVWIVRNNEIIEIKGDKQPIGNFETARAFTNHTFDLVKGDIIYLFSDGYIDQFGGDKGKKLKSQSLRDLLLEIAHKSMDNQREELLKAFNDWKGDLEQVDDVCVIGVRI